MMKIALTFSGGGFRAAAFSLGSLSLLDKIKTAEGTLLDHVIVLSTVSGGTITGARFALDQRKTEPFKTTYDHLYDFLSKSDLITKALDRLASNKDWDDKRVRNLITAFADIYDTELFQSAKFGEIMTSPPKGLRHISFNATEFSNALQFRFQWTEKILHPAANEPDRGIIGNSVYRLENEIAKQIRLADIMAASSCFPGGFEPVNFPDDFVWPKDQDLKSVSGAGYPVGLMDGGIVDNQGIEPVLLAEARMKRNVYAQPNGTQPNVLDLIIVCEVASPYMEGFQANQQHKSQRWKKLSPAELGWINFALLLVCGIFGFFTYIHDWKVWLMITTSVFSLSMAIFLLSGKARSFAASAGIPNEFLKPLGKLLKLKLFIYENLIMNRFRSVLMLTMNVFLKHVRRLNYRTLYNDKSWLNRRIMNGIYELRNGEETLQSKIDQGRLPPALVPSTLICANSDLAASMGTTLWFTPDQLEKEKMLDAIIACGQYNLCWNLLEYIDQIKKDPTNTNSNHQTLIDCEPQLMALWDQFQANPKCFI